MNMIYGFSYTFVLTFLVATVSLTTATSMAGDDQYERLEKAFLSAKGVKLNEWDTRQIWEGKGVRKFDSELESGDPGYTTREWLVVDYGNDDLPIDPSRLILFWPFELSGAGTYNPKTNAVTYQNRAVGKVFDAVNSSVNRNFKKPYYSKKLDALVMREPGKKRFLVRAKGRGNNRIYLAKYEFFVGGESRVLFTKYMAFNKLHYKDPHGGKTSAGCASSVKSKSKRVQTKP